MPKMKSQFRFIVTPSKTVLAAIVLALSGEALLAQPLVVPSDALVVCKPAVGEWVGEATGKVPFVNPPNSLMFPSEPFSAHPDCPFYEWAAHLFLWITSQDKTGSYVFRSPAFYKLSPPSVSISSRGPGGRLVLFDETGMHGVRFARSILDQSGTPVMIAHVTGKDGIAVFLDQDGKAISYRQKPDGTPFGLLDTSNPGQPINLPNGSQGNGQGHVLDEANDVIIAEPDEEYFGTHVLMMQKNTTQPGSLTLPEQEKRLVYYIIHVNDVFAYFRTGTANGTISLDQYPTTEEELNQITAAFGSDHCFADAQVLAIELKSAWIELPQGVNSDDYISIDEQVPDYLASDGKYWKKKDALRPAKLALVGMHVVFSVPGHPELIWATFEHENNAPNPPYNYSAIDYSAVDLDRSKTIFAGSLFSSPDRSATANKPHMTMKGQDIVALPGDTIAPSDVFRINPWGLNPSRTPGDAPDIISTNNAVRAALDVRDARRHYVLIGATWFRKGTAQGAPDGTVEGTVDGSRLLANSVIETFAQPSNCLDCHKGSSNGGKIDLRVISHIFGRLPANITRVGGLPAAPGAACGR